jgi:aminoglycoside 2''-phosphotransferase
VPRPFFTSPEIIAYPLITGDPLTKSLLDALDSTTRQAAAGELGRFLHQLHSLPIASGLPATRTPVTLSAWQNLEERIRMKVYPLMLPHQRRWAEALFAPVFSDENFFSYSPCLVHGDLAPYHILFDTQAGSVAGVIDFGVAGVGDPATDLAALLQAYGEAFLRGVLQTYPAGHTHLKRARFYAQAIEFQWILLGLESGEKFWFTAHLGGARDIWD